MPSGCFILSPECYIVTLQCSIVLLQWSICHHNAELWCQCNLCVCVYMYAWVHTCVGNMHVYVEAREYYFSGAVYFEFWDSFSLDWISAHQVGWIVWPVSLCVVELNLGSLVLIVSLPESRDIWRWTFEHALFVFTDVRRPIWIVSWTLSWTIFTSFCFLMVNVMWPAFQAHTALTSPSWWTVLWKSPFSLSSFCQSTLLQQEKKQRWCLIHVRQVLCHWAIFSVLKIL